jgi:hypothetical protein
LIALIILGKELIALSFFSLGFIYSKQFAIGFRAGKFPGQSITLISFSFSFSFP